MRVIRFFQSLGSRLRDTTGSSSIEYAMNTLLSATIVAALVSAVQSAGFHALLMQLLDLLFQALPKLLTLL